MSQPAAQPASQDAASISFRDLFAYHFDETRRWRAWLSLQAPALLDVRAGDAPIEKVRDLLHHIFIVEWVYMQALTSQPFDRWNTFKSDSLDNIFALADETESGLRKIVESATQANLETEAVIPAPTMTLKGSRRKFLVHTFLHSARHWAQLAMIARANGYKTDWQHDLVLSDVIK